MMLSPREKALLKAAANKLRLPVSVALGKGAIDDALLRAADKALKAHGLIKVKALPSAGPIKELGPELASSLNAEWVDSIGKTGLLYRPSDNPKAFKLNKDR